MREIKRVIKREIKKEIKKEGEQELGVWWGNRASSGRREDPF